MTAGFEVVSEMRSILWTKKSIIAVVVAMSLPLLPLLLTMIPLQEILPRVLKLSV